jgi:RNA polymerase sigma-70 factor (ECF subfamily)
MSEYNYMTDEQLVKLCLQKNAAAQERLYNLFAPKMWPVCLRYMKNEEEAQDVLQMGFVKVFNHLQDFNKTGSLEGWIRRIIINTALDHLRKNKKYENNIAWDDVAYQQEDHTINILQQLAAEDLLQLINNLPIGFKTVFNLYAIEGYSHKEIAEMLGITESTSKSQYSRAKAVLRKIIKEKHTDIYCNYE